MSNWDFNWITDWDTIWSEAFQHEWMGWMEADPESHVFFHPALVKAWVETYLPLRRIDPRFLVARQGGTTVFLPLILWRRNWKNAWQRLLVPVGYSDFDYHDPIWAGSRDEKAEAGFWKALDEWAGSELAAGRVDGARLSGLRLGGSSIPSGMLHETGEKCPQRSLEGCADGESFLKKLKGSLRGDVRRQMRRLEEQGPLEFRLYAPEEIAEAKTALKPFLEAHETRWPRAYRAPGYHLRLIEQGLAGGVLHFSELRVAGKAISWHLGFIWKDRFYYYCPAYSDAFANLSPSKMHLFFCVRDAIERRLKVFDLLQGAEAYKMDWADATTALYEWRRQAPGALSRLRNGWVNQWRPALERRFRSVTV